MKIDKKYYSVNMLILLLLVLNVLLGWYIAFFKPWAYALETLKVWGRKNMKMAVQLYKSDMYKEQQSLTLQQILDSMWQPQENTGTSPSPEVSALTLDADALAAIKKDAFIYGKKDTRITIIEYSDLLCPFCKRHYNDQTIEKVVAAYSNDVQMIFKQFPIPQLHPTAPLWAQAVWCAGKIGGSDKFYAYLGKAFALSDFTEENLTELATKLKLKSSSFASCLTSAETVAQVNAEIDEAKSFGIQGTPGHVIVDNKNGTYVLIPWAYPFEAFESEIKKILEN